MKQLIKQLTIVFIALITISCDKTPEENISFYDSKHRIGLWVNSEMRDTLKFVNNSNLIRKGKTFLYEEYTYRIDREHLFVRLPKLSNETKHPIWVEDKNTVVLGNMYLTVGFNNNSGVFIKQN